MKRIFIPLFIFVLFASTTAFAAVETSAIYSWNNISVGSSDYTMRVVDDTTYGKALYVNKRDTGTRVGVSNSISMDKLESGKVYVVEYAVKMNNGHYWTKTGWWTNISGAYAEPYGGNLKGNWRSYYHEMTCAGDDLYVCFFIQGQIGEAWFADIRVYAKDDSEKTNLLVNGDFASDFTVVENVDYADGKITWDIPSVMNGDSVNIYKRENGSTAVLLNDTPVAVTDKCFTVDISSENSFYIDIYTCSGNIQSDKVATCSKLGARDIFEYELFDGTVKISSPQKALLTVKIPVQNNSISEGYGFTAIVILKENGVAKKVCTENFNVPMGVLISCEVNVDVDYDVTEDTRIEVHLWDSLETMNIIRDVQVF